MNKAEFLNYLEKRLAVLNQKEREDIISEYSQHIDMKVQSGLSEEEAIKDFGNIHEFVDDILSAYNVDPNYKNSNFDTEKIEETIHEGVGVAKTFGSKIKHFMKKIYNNISHLAKNIANSFKINFDDNKSIKSTFVKLIILSLRIFVLIFVLPCFLFIPFTIAGLGLLIALTFMGYPCFGATIACLGFNMSSIAVFAVIVKYVYLSKFEKVEVKNDEA